MKLYIGKTSLALVWLDIFQLIATAICALDFGNGVSQFEHGKSYFLMSYIQFYIVMINSYYSRLNIILNILLHSVRIFFNL